jgi:hypothetical protein
VDFVVAGFGLGAAIVLGGFAVHDLGPLVRRRARDDPRRSAWSAVCRSIGMVAIGAGLAICLVTLLALILGVGDGTGRRLVTAVSIVAIPAAAAWSAILLRRYARAAPAPSVSVADRAPAFSADWAAGVAKPVASVPRPARQQAPAPAASDRVPDPTPPAADSTADTPEPVVETPSPPPAPAVQPVEPASPSSNGALFASPLLADVAADQHAGFRSSLLADLSLDAAADAPAATADSAAESSPAADPQPDAVDPAAAEPAVGDPASAIDEPPIASSDTAEAETAETAETADVPVAVTPVSTPSR